MLSLGPAWLENNFCLKLSIKKSRMPWWYKFEYIFLGNKEYFVQRCHRTKERKIAQSKKLAAIQNFRVLRLLLLLSQVFQTLHCYTKLSS